jgi:ribosomal protein L24E
MFFERSTRRFSRLRTTLAVMGLVGSSLALSIPARAFIDSGDKDPTELYVPEAGYIYDAPRTPGRLTPATGALFGSHSDEISEKRVPNPDKPDRNITVPADHEDQGIWKLEQLIGRTLDIDNHYTTPFNYYEGKTELDRQEFLDLEKNRIPLVGWQCGVSTDITSGKLDKAIHDTAAVMKAYPRDFFMRYCWEMDGQRPEKSDLVGTPQQFIDAWRYIYNMFKADGVTNVVWVWTANANGYKVRYDFPGIGKVPPAPLFYPGDDYVDWVAADGYNWHGAEGPNGQDDYRNFLEIYDQFMDWARTADPAHQKGASTKPIMVGEYGSQEQHDDGTLKAEWYRNAHETVKPRPAGLSPDQDKWKGAYSDVQAMVYYDVDGKSGPWYVNTTEKSVQGYKEAALDPWFNQIQTLNWGPYTGGSGGIDPGPGTGGTTTTTTPTTQTTNPPITVKTQSGRNGYWMLGQDGKVYAFGQSKHLGAPTLPAGVSAADLEVSPTGNGYWIVDSAGNVSGYGDATALGGIAAGALAPGETVTSLSATPTGKGYWIFTSKGRAVRFGDATFFGDVSKVQLAGPVLDSIPSATGQGYYMVASDGGIFAFGDAIFHGSMGGTKLNKPVQSLVPDPDGTGYWLVASDGGIFAFKSDFRGSLGNTKLNKPITGMVPYGDGYMMVGEDGGIFNFSNKPFDGSLGGNPPARPIVSVSVLP